MSKIDDLVKIMERVSSDFYSLPADLPVRHLYQAQVVAIVRALRDEFGRIMYPGDDWNRQGVLEQFDQILGDAGDEVAHICDGDEGPSLHQTPATDPAPAPCLWRVHHETRNGPLYVSQCDGEWRHATADPKCPSCKKEIFFVTDPAPAVCVWVPQDEGPAHEIWKTGCGTMYERAKSTGWCGKCKAPIKFTEAKT